MYESNNSIKTEKETYTSYDSIKSYECTKSDEKAIRERLFVVGCGGAGCNTISRLFKTDIKNTTIVGVNTDSQHLDITSSHKKILIGEEITNGLGAGNDPKIGELAAKETEHILKNELRDADLVFITCGLGGGTGTGAAPIIADIAKRHGALTIAIVTLPFTMEGNRRVRNAKIGLQRLRENCDTVVIIPNDILLNINPNLPVIDAFEMADETLINAVRSMSDLIHNAGLVNLDLADICTVMQNGGLALISVGIAEGDNRAQDAIERALNSPMLYRDIAGAKSALINIWGGSSLKLSEAKLIIEKISKELSDDSQIIWGTCVDEDLNKKLKVIIIAVGLSPKEDNLNIEESITDEVLKEV